MVHDWEHEDAAVRCTQSAAEGHGERTGHPEYDKYTLDAEYKRDVAKGLPIHVPVNYYPDDDPEQPPLFRWRAHAHLLYENWLNYYVYQNTPYDLGEIQRVKHGK